MVGKLVSVIIPCYNNGRYLADAIDSVLSQTYRPLEIIVVDDGSTDDSAEVARRYGHEIELIQIGNSGPAAARNAGLRIASGEYVQFLDADDRLEPRKIETHARYLDNHPEIGLVYGDARVFTTDQPDLRWFKRAPGGGDGPWIESHSQSPGTWLDRCLGQPPFHSCCPVFRRSLVSRFGGLDDTLAASEDWEFWIRLAASGVEFAFHSDSDALVLIRYSPTSLTTRPIRMREGHMAMRLIIAKYLDDQRRLNNFWVGIAMIRRYYTTTERPIQVARLMIANWGPALRASLLRSSAEFAAGTRTGRGVRWVARRCVPYSWRCRLRARIGVTNEE